MSTTHGTVWVCVHGHYYQPPRENPWTGIVDREPSALPYHDWNARITVECYRANSAAARLGPSGEIRELVDNYALSSWNMGPTLLRWLEQHAPHTYAALLHADQASALRFGGHGSAMAQAFGHLIMPLASARDKATQVRWGIADFTQRFRRRPEGMWLPECAVDVATLEALAAEGIGFTVLAPHQAAGWRRPGQTHWHHDGIDTTRVYRCPLPSGRSIDLFFYDGAVARGVAFDKLLVDGNAFAQALRHARGTLRVPDGPVFAPPLHHIATDGETYGHHHRFGDMALAWALLALQQDPAIRLTNYAEYRARFPAQYEVCIVPNSSWSCAHGVARWRDDCGCNSGGRPGWRQHWRRPLRMALEWLRDQIDAAMSRIGAVLFRDPWAARDAYYAVLSDDTAWRWQRFLQAHAAFALSATEAQTARDLLTASTMGMAMFTSCGWFFDDLGGIETVQVMKYAARAAEALAAAGGGEVTHELRARLAHARSNDPQLGDGAQIFDTLVANARKQLPLADKRAQILADVAQLEHALEDMVVGHRQVLADALAAFGELPSTLRGLMALMLRRRVIAELQRGPQALPQLRELVALAREYRILLDEPTVVAAASQALTAALSRYARGAATGVYADGDFAALVAAVRTMLELLPATDVFEARAIMMAMWRDHHADWRRRAAAGESGVAARLQDFATLLHLLGLAPVSDDSAHLQPR